KAFKGARRTMQSRASIRPAAAGDIPAFNRIDMSYSAPFGYAYRVEDDETGCPFFLEETRFAEPFEREYDWDWSELDDFAASVEKGLVWGAFDPKTGKPLGLLELRESEWNGALWFQSLFVHRPARGKGVGASLLDAAVRHAAQRGARALFVETQVSNGPAIRFYRARGFRPCGLNDHYYTND